MPALRDVLGPHAYMFAKYGIRPDDDICEAASRLEREAPHLSRLLRELLASLYAAGGV